MTKQEHNERNKWDFHDHLVTHYDYIKWDHAMRIGRDKYGLGLQDAAEVWRKQYQEEPDE